MLASCWAIGTVFVLIVLKSYAYIETGSTAILATLADSLTDACISIVMLIALRYALRPADKSHRHGHGKMEGIAALFQAAFLSGAGLFLIFEAFHRFAEPRLISNHTVGITVAGISVVLSLLLVMVQNYALKRAPSMIIAADQAHYKTDILLNGSVMLAMVVSLQGGPAWVDPACAIFVALYYGLTAVKIAADATDMLMDRELPEAVRNRIKDIIKRHPDVLGFHDLRTRKSGMVLHISFDVEIEASLSLKDAHEISRALEHDILDDYPMAEIIIHKDPYGDIHDTRHNQGVIH
jgi:ferrous-iron efflux pump FieF